MVGMSDDQEQVGEGFMMLWYLVQGVGVNEGEGE